MRWVERIRHAAVINNDKHGEKHLFDHCRIDYFAVSLPDLAIWEDDLDKRNCIHCNYVMGLGYLGLREMGKAIDFWIRCENWTLTIKVDKSIVICVLYEKKEFFPFVGNIVSVHFCTGTNAVCL